MIFDTHAHSYFDGLRERETEVFANMLASNVTHSVQIGCDLVSSIAAIALAKRHPNTYATVGFHPTDAQDPETRKIRSSGSDTKTPETSEGIIEAMRNLIENNKGVVVAIGETGLDYYHLTPGKESRQKAEQDFWLAAQVSLAREFDLPLVIHSRDAAEETLGFIKQFDIRRAVIHCFSQDWAFAEELLRFSEGIVFSFSGILTYPSAKAIAEVAGKLPLDRILVETDAPFLSPAPKKRTEINESANVKHTLDFLKTLRSEDPETVERTVFKNSCAFYGISE